MRESSLFGFSLQECPLVFGTILLPNVSSLPVS
jgi:hypothetical protein